MAPPLNAALVTAWLRDGTFDRLVAGVRAEAMARQRLAARHLAGRPYRAHPQGYHLWLETGAGIDPDALVGRLAPLGLSVVPGHAFAVAGAVASDARPANIRLSVGGAIDHGSLEQALSVLNDLLAPGGRNASR